MLNQIGTELYAWPLLNLYYFKIIFNYSIKCYLVFYFTGIFLKIPAIGALVNSSLASNENAYISGIQIQLKNIPKYIQIKRQTYTIRGAINLIRGRSNITSAHFWHF